MAYSEPRHFLVTQQHVPSVQRGALSFMHVQAMPRMRALHTGGWCGSIANMPFVLSSPFVVFHFPCLPNFISLQKLASYVHGACIVRQFHHHPMYISVIIISKCCVIIIKKMKTSGKIISSKMKRV